VIQSILGHAQPLTTQRYQHADLTISGTALTRLANHLTSPDGYSGLHQSLVESRKVGAAQQLLEWVAGG
jgi:hypothetical protein